eukprot:UN24410
MIKIIIILKKLFVMKNRNKIVIFYNVWMRHQTMHDVEFHHEIIDGDFRGIFQ